MKKGFLLKKKIKSHNGISLAPMSSPLNPAVADEVERREEQIPPILWDGAMRHRLQGSMQSLMSAIKGISLTELERYNLQARQYCEAWHGSPAGYKLETIVDHDTSASNAWLREEMLDIAYECDDHLSSAPSNAEKNGGFSAAADPNLGITTNRIQTALSFVFLSNAASNLDHIGLAKSLIKQLSAYIYDGAIVDDSRSTLRECLGDSPKFEKFVVMRSQVDKLVGERVKLEREEQCNEKHRRTRKKLIATAVTYRRRGCMQFFWVQWSGNVRSLNRQREALIQKLLKGREKTPKQIFDAWRVWAVDQKLIEQERNSVETNIQIANIEDELRHVRAIEEETRVRVDKLRKDEINLQKRLAETNAAIEAQRVPETLRYIEVAGGAAEQMGHLILDIVTPLLNQIQDSPCYGKVAQMYWSVRDEERAAVEDEMLMEAEAEERWKVQVMTDKRKKREEKIRATAFKKMEKNRMTAEKDARTKAEDEYRGSFEEGDPGFSRDDMEAAAVAAAKSAGYILERECQAWLKERDRKEKVRRVEAEAEQAEQAKKNEIAFYAARAEKDAEGPGLSEEDILKSENDLQELACEEILLRWLKYHLRRTCRKGYQYRRKCENYNEDLRDGVAYLMLFKSLVPKIYRTEERKIYEGDETKMLDSEIDPNIRLAALFKMAAALPYPATGFNTEGHILGNDSFSNGAFISRLFMSNHGLFPDTHDSSDIGLARQKVSKVVEMWSNVCTLINQLGNWENWSKSRKEYDSDEKFKAVLSTIPECASQIRSLMLMLHPMAMAAERGRKLFVGLRKRVLHELQWKIFTIKALQEDEAPNGVDINLEEGHAPIRLVNRKFERKFRKYTELQMGRVRLILEETKLRDETKERHWAKIAEVARQAKEAKRKVAPGEDDLNADDLADIKASVGIPADEEVRELHTEWCKLLRLNYNDISGVFKFYAAGEGGSADGLSSSEWWNVCNDINIMNDIGRIQLEKLELQEIFEQTETPEEIEATKKTTERKAFAEKVAVKILSDDGNAQDDQEDGSGKDEDEDEDEDDDIIAFGLTDGERELGPEAFVEGILRLSMRKFPGTDPEKFITYDERLRRMLNEYVIPNAGKSNTETFRGELSLDEVQLVYKKFKPYLFAMFIHYGREHEPVPGQPKPEPSMDGQAFLKMLKESKVTTRAGDLRDDFRETAARKVFNDTQIEEESANSIDTGGGTDEMIYMEYLEAWGAIAQYKYPNPYIPLQVKLEELFTGGVIKEQKEYALKKMPAHAGSKKNKNKKNQGGE